MMVLREVRKSTVEWCDVQGWDCDVQGWDYLVQCTALLSPDLGKKAQHSMTFLNAEEP